MNKISQFCISFIVSSAMIFMQSSAMAAVTYQFIQHTSLIGHDPGKDGYWGTPDDDDSAVQDSTTGNASSTFISGVPVDYFSGSYVLSTPLRSPGSTTFEQMGTTSEGGRVGVLKLDRSRTLTYTGPQTFVSTSTTSSNTGDVTTNGVSGYILYNQTGLDDPTIFGNPELTTHFNLMKTLVPSGWTVITVEQQSYDGNYPMNKLISSAYSIDTDAIPDFVNDGDVNGDGKADIFWRNSVTNENRIFLMDGNVIITDAPINIIADASWEIAGLGDFNKDGRSDILWRNNITVHNHISLMNGTETPVGVNLDLINLTSSKYEVRGIVDLDNDGYKDIFWQYAGSALGAFTFMNGTSERPGGGSGIFFLPVSWNVEIVTDFNGDGYADRLYRHIETREVWMNLMVGSITTNGGGAGEHVAYTGNNWDIVGVSDFNDDGQSDILWRNNTDGHLWMYLMNGATISNGTSEAPGEHVAYTSLEWDIVAIGDYNGDGKKDIFWRNSVDGRNHMYLMDGTSPVPSEGVPVTTVSDLNWEVQGL